MTDAPDLTPEQEAVRRLLADARHEGPTPPEVVARLDDALAALVSERGDASSTDAPADHATRAPVVDLGARRRRWVGTGLLAAAAVVVAGVALGQALPRNQGSNDADSAAGGDVASSESRDFSDDDGGSDSGSAGPEAPESLKSSAVAPDEAYPTLSSTDVDLEDDLVDLRAGLSASSVQHDSARLLGDCDLSDLGQGRRSLAEVDGQVGVVVFRHPDGAVQRADLYVCGSTVPVRTLTLPAP